MAEPTIDAGAGPVALPRSPLAHLEERMCAAAVTGARGVTLTEWPFITMVKPRVDPASEGAGRIEKYLGAVRPHHRSRLSHGRLARP
jgi:sarcosine oxidase subunit gamma